MVSRHLRRITFDIKPKHIIIGQTNAQQPRKNEMNAVVVDV